MLDEYHQSIVAGIREHFGDSLKTVGSYWPAEQQEQLLDEAPAVWVEVERMNHIKDLGDGRDALQCNVIIYCVLAADTQELQPKLRNLSAEMMRFIKNETFGKCEAKTLAKQISAMPGRFKVGEKGFDSWVVSFTQTIFLDDSDKDKKSTIPQKIYARSDKKVEQVI